MNNEEITPQEQHYKEVFADFGRSIQQLRQHHGLTVEDAAARLDMSEKKLAAVERGSMHNNLNTVWKYVEAMQGRLAIIPQESPDDPHCQFIELED